MKRAAVVALLACVICVPAALAIDVQNTVPALGPHNLLTLYTSDVLAHTQFALGMVGNYATNPLQLELARSKTELAVVESAFSGHFSVALGLFDRVDLLAATSYYRVKGADMDQVDVEGLPQASGSGGTSLGDSTLAVKANFLRNKPGSIGLGALLFAALPTGDEEIYGGNGATSIGAALILDKRFDRVNMVFNAGYRSLGSPDNLSPTPQIFGGGGVDVAVAKWLGLTGEFVARTQDYGIDAIDAMAPAEALFGTRFFTPVGLSFLAAVGFGITDGIGSPETRVLAGVSATYPPLKYGPPPAARRPTGIAAIDSPDFDTDHDGLNNADEKHVYKTDPTKPDSDGDGVLDGEEVTQHHTDPLKADTDGDGLSDGAELRLHSTNPLVADSDGDGLSDGQEVNETGTNPISADSDNDGVPDGVDGAPLEPETVNGYFDEDGVPEVVLARKSNGLILFENQIVLPTALTFDGEAGKRLSASDKRELGEVAKLLAEFPNLLVQVEGHVAAGTADAAALSSERATAVRNYLVGRKVAADRLTAVGMGDEVPIASNDTPEGRAKNTRIDFLITGR